MVLPNEKKFDNSTLNIYVDGGVKHNKAYASVYLKCKDIEYYSLLGGIGHITTTQAETLAVYNGLCLAQKLFLINPYYNINLYTDLEFLSEILTGKRRLKQRYFESYKGLVSILSHPIIYRLGVDLNIIKVASKENLAHSVIKSGNFEIDEESIVFFSKEINDRWNSLDTMEGMKIAYMNAAYAACPYNQECDFCCEEDCICYDREKEVFVDYA